MPPMPAALETMLDLLEAKSLVPLAFVLLMIFLVLRRRPRTSTRTMATQSSKPDKSAMPPTTAPPQQLRQDLESLVVELEELARKINAQIDTRFAKLEAVIRDADRRIAVLERLTRQAEQASRSPREQAPPDNAQHEVVYKLADDGKTPIEIARQLGRTPGEIELILNLRGKPEPPPKPAPKKRKTKRKKKTPGDSPNT